MGSTIALAEAVAVEPLFLPEGWEIKVVGSAEELDLPAGPAAQLISSDERTGEVTAIVGVTGIVDHVADLIEPGAYRDTLAKRRPKVCWAHSWEQPIGKVLRIEEWMPGDPRFAQVKATLNGQPWPAEAGALVATMQMNMKSDRGREAFAAVDFYSETGECEWSIGWQTVPGQTTRRKDGVRVCKKVELYEVSPVLFGAAPLTRTLQVKSIALADAYIGAPNVMSRVGKSADGAVVDAPEDDDENELHRRAKDEIDWAEVEAAATGAAAPAQEEKRYGDGARVVDLSALATGGTLDFAALAAGLDVKVDTPGDGHRGNAHALINSYEHGKLAARIRWGEPGDFGRCVDIAGKHMTPDQAKGFCNLRHHGALGVYPGQEDGKSAGTQAAELLAKSWNPLLEVGLDAAHVDRKSMGSGQLRGTFEQRRESLDRALTEAIRPLHATRETPDDDGQPVPMGGEQGWVSIDGTWDDRVVATFIRYSNGGPDERQTYEVDYSWDGEDVTLIGEPRPVELQVTVVPVAAGAELTAGDIEDAVLAPGLDLFDNGIVAMKAALAHRPEVKAGRVLSEANASRLRGAIEHLLEVARAAGIELPGWTGPDQATPAGTDATPDTTAPGTAAVASGGAPTEVKVLSIADVNAQLAELGNFLS